MRWIVGVLAITKLSGCGCTLIGCISTVRLEFAPVSIEGEAYVFAMTGPGIQASTRCTDGVCEYVETTGGTLQPSFATFPDVVDGVSLDWEDTTPGPETVTLSVSRGGSVVAQVVVDSLTYQESYPNGERCDDEPCYHASRVIDLGL